MREKNKKPGVQCVFTNEGVELLTRHRADSFGGLVAQAGWTVLRAIERAFSDHVVLGKR